MDLPLGFSALAVASAIVFVGAFVQGSTGFGLGTLGVPLLLLIDPMLVPGPVLLLALVLTVLMVLRERTSIRREDLSWGIVGRLIGTGVATLVIREISRDTVAILIGSLVLVAVGMLQFGLRMRLSRENLVAAGAMSGFMGTVASVGGPPMAMLYFDQKGPEQRSTMSALFIVGVVMALAALAVVDRFGTPEILLAAVLSPAMLLGFGLSRYGASFLDRGYTKPAILVVSAVSAVVTILRYLIW